jgi:hypothetical protein
LTCLLDQILTFSLYARLVLTSSYITNEFSINLLLVSSSSPSK